MKFGSVCNSVHSSKLFSIFFAASTCSNTLGNFGFFQILLTNKYGLEILILNFFVSINSRTLHHELV